jgi:hypothetical protein
MEQSLRVQTFDALSRIITMTKRWNCLNKMSPKRQAMDRISQSIIDEGKAEITVDSSVEFSFRSFHTVM